MIYSSKIHCSTILSFQLNAIQRIKKQQRIDDALKTNIDANPETVHDTSYEQQIPNSQDALGTNECAQNENEQSPDGKNRTGQDKADIISPEVNSFNLYFQIVTFDLFLKKNACFFSFYDIVLFFKEII